MHVPLGFRRQRAAQLGPLSKPFRPTSFKLILKLPNRVGILRTSRHSPCQPIFNPAQLLHSITLARLQRIASLLAVASRAFRLSKLLLRRFTGFPRFLKLMSHAGQRRLKLHVSLGFKRQRAAHLGPLSQPFRPTCFKLILKLPNRVGIQPSPAAPQPRSALAQHHAGSLWCIIMSCNRDPHSSAISYQPPAITCIPSCRRQPCLQTQQAATSTPQRLPSLSEALLHAGQRRRR